MVLNPSPAAAFTRTRRESLTPAECSDNTYGDGLARSEATIVPGGDSGTRTLTRTTKTFAGAVVVEENDSATSASPDSTTTYVAGRPVSRTVPGATTVESWAYDQLGRETRHTDPRGASTITTYNAAGQVETVTDPAGKRTSYTYHPPNLAAAGMVDTITNPLGKTKVHAYDNLRRVTSVSGTATYPLGYSYDGYSALETLTTWRTAGNGSTAAVTTWVHDPHTGLLHKKFYQGQSVNDPAWEYTYYPDGRVHTRESLEGRVTTYNYNDFGDPATLTYTNDGNLTPDVTYSGHDRLGRPGSVSVGGDSATLSYDPVSGAESITYAENHSSLPDVAVVADDADAAGRPTGFEVTLDSTPAHANTLVYAADLDHLSSVTSAAGSTALA
jgi:YD repeat-containing protein